MDEKGMMQDLGQGDGDLVLGPVWQTRPHNNSTGDRTWFTITVYQRADGYIPPPDITLEGKAIDPRCYEAAPGHMICTNSTGMQNSATHLKSIQNFLRNYAPAADSTGAYEKDKINGPIVLGFDNASIHIQSEPLEAIDADGHFGVSLPSHATRILMNLDNGFNSRFSTAFKKFGGIALMREPNPVRWKLCSVIHQAYLEAAGAKTTLPQYADDDLKHERAPIRHKVILRGELETQNVGWCPFGPQKPLERLQKHFGRTLADPDGKLGSSTRQGASKTRFDRKIGSATFAAQEDLKNRLTDRVLQVDIPLQRKFMRGAVKRGNGEVEWLDEIQYDQFKAWQLKQLAKRAETSMSTQGELLTAAEFLEILRERKRKREKAVADAAERQEKRAKNAELKVIEAEDKRRTLVETLAKEARVKEVLLNNNFWTSAKPTIKGGDMKDFIKHNAKLLKGHDGYATNLRNDDALEFLDRVLSETNESVQWNQK
eukprot:SAG31_NODE_3703_length_3974_cov_7.925161_2_plen_486_part_00